MPRKENCTQISQEYNTVNSPTWTDLWGPLPTDGVGNAPPGIIYDNSEIHFIETCNVEYECDARARSMICGRSSRVSFSVKTGLCGHWIGIKFCFSVSKNP